MTKFSQLATEAVLNRTIAALKGNNIDSIVVSNKEEAKEKVLQMIPDGAQVMTMSSVTVDATGIPQAINESGKHVSVKKELAELSRETHHRQMQQMGSAPEYSIGSVHAVTQDGKVVVASNTGSQLPAYAYGADKVIWVVGTQKIVLDLDQAMKRIYDYVLPLESVRLNKQYNITSGSFVSKLLIFNRELAPGRVTVVFVREVLGF